jgi:hypothetical protein
MAKTPAKSLVTNALIDRIIKASGNELADHLDKSDIINNKDWIKIAVHVMNIALTGELDGHFEPGLMQIAGPSKHFKTLFMLIIMKAYLEKYPHAVAVIFDAEGGAAKKYFRMVGIDTARVSHIPISNIEELKRNFTKVLHELKRGEKVFFGIDSIGNLASIKEIEDALSDNEASDMTRAKQLKSLGRIITPSLVNKDLFCVAVNHTYKTMEKFATNVVGGGTGLYYSADNVWIIGREQETKETAGKKKLLGYNFNIVVDKSRSVKEKSKFEVYVDFTTGIDIYSGLLDIALLGGFIIQPTAQSYALRTTPANTVKMKDINELLSIVIEDPLFKEYVKDAYQLKETKMFGEASEVVQEEQED